MQGPAGWLSTVTFPTGAGFGFAQVQRIVIDGTRGAIFEYDVNNNLVGSWAASAGVDPYGNGYPAGFDLSGPTSLIEGLAATLNPGPLLLYGNPSTVVVIFNSSQNFTGPAGVTAVQVEGWAPGGGGGSSNSAQFPNGSGNGGGGGEYFLDPAVAVTATNLYAMTIPAGAASGVNGGNTIFPGDSVTRTAHGGKAGGINNGGAGLGGTGSNAPVHFDGGPGGGPGNGGGAGSGGSGGTSSSGAAGQASTGNTGGLGAIAVTGGGPGVIGGSQNTVGRTPSPGPGGGGSGAGLSSGGVVNGGTSQGGQIRITYSPSGVSSLLMAMSSTPGTDPITGAVYPGPGFSFAPTIAPAALSGWTTLYGAGSTPQSQLGYVNQAGFVARIPGYQLALITAVTVTAATLTTLRSGTILNGDAEAGAIYALVASGDGTFGSTAASNALTFQLSLGPTPVSLGSLVVGSTFTNISTGFRWKIYMEAVCVAPGAGATWFGSVFGNISITGANLLPAIGANASMGFDAGVAASQTVPSNANAVMALQAAWAATTGAPTITSRYGYFGRVA